MAEAAYRRLPGVARNFGASYSLWLGSDHVLQVSAAFGMEHYRRWYLRDIQALIIRRTSRRVLWNVIWGGIGALAGAATAGLVGLAAASTNADGRIPLYVMAGMAGAVVAACSGMILWNSLLGPSCTVFVQTPAGLQALAAPVRIRAAQAALQELRPLIEAAQSPNAGTQAS